MKAQRETEAAVEFQKLLDHAGAVLADPVGVVARLQVVRIFARSGNTAKAEYAKLQQARSGSVRRATL